MCQDAAELKIFLFKKKFTNGFHTYYRTLGWEYAADETR